MSIEAEFKTYTISELSKSFDVTPRALRLYEESGLLSPKREGSKRVYFERDRVRLRLLLRGKRLGYSLAEIKELFDIYESNSGEEGQLLLLLETMEVKRKQLETKKIDVEIALQEIEKVTKTARKTLKEISSTKE
ncbi:MAG: DNA-binding transcriptional MerR regulator [Cocleimonas sp.]|jgi:DNA-binding transcriptional MerR regulator